MTDDEFDAAIGQYMKRFGDPIPDSRGVAFALMAQDEVGARLMQALETGEPIADWRALEAEILAKRGGALVMTAAEVQRRL